MPSILFGSQVSLLFRLTARTHTYAPDLTTGRLLLGCFIPIRHVDRFRQVNVVIGVIFQSVLCDTLESCVHIEVLLCRGLKVGNVALRSAPRFRLLLGHLEVEGTTHEHTCVYV